MSLLVPAPPGSPGQNPESYKMVVCVCVSVSVCLRVLGVKTVPSVMVRVRVRVRFRKYKENTTEASIVMPYLL